MTSAKSFAGVLLVIVPLVFTAGFTGLQATFDYPDILRQPGGEVLTRFAASGVDLHIYWYAMMAAALGMIPATLAAGLHFWKRDNLLGALSIAFGVLAGLVQALGLIRWVMLTPGLAAAYVATGASEIEKAASVSIFDAANLYLGQAVGEHLGYLFTGLWTLVVSTIAIADRRIFGTCGWLLSAAVMAGMAEPFGAPLAADINAIGYSLWALWVLILGVMMLREGANARISAAQTA